MSAQATTATVRNYTYYIRVADAPCRIRLNLVSRTHSNYLVFGTSRTAFLILVFSSAYWHPPDSLSFFLRPDRNRSHGPECR
jgi:hypothetical protein